MTSMTSEDSRDSTPTGSFCASAAPGAQLTEDENRFFRVSKLLLEIMSGYLRTLFENRWDIAYPQFIWKHLTPQAREEYLLYGIEGRIIQVRSALALPRKTKEKNEVKVNDKAEFDIEIFNKCNDRLKALEELKANSNVSFVTPGASIEQKFEFVQIGPKKGPSLTQTVVTAPLDTATKGKMELPAVGSAVFVHDGVVEHEFIVANLKGCKEYNGIQLFVGKAQVAILLPKTNDSYIALKTDADDGSAAGRLVRIPSLDILVVIEVIRRNAWYNMTVRFTADEKDRVAAAVEQGVTAEESTHVTAAEQKKERANLVEQNIRSTLQAEAGRIGVCENGPTDTCTSSPATVFLEKGIIFYGLDDFVKSNLLTCDIALYDMTTLDKLFFSCAHVLLDPNDREGEKCIKALKQSRNKNFAHQHHCAIDPVSYEECVKSCKRFIAHFFSQDVDKFDDVVENLHQVVVDNALASKMLAALEAQALSLEGSKKRDLGMINTMQKLLLGQMQLAEDLRRAREDNSLNFRLARLVAFPEYEEEELRCYVPLNGDIVRRSDIHSDSEKAALTFISAPAQSVMVVFAESGGGKTMFLKHMWRVLVRQYHADASGAVSVPIFISLASIAARSVKTVISDALALRGICDSDVKQMEVEGKQIVFLLDGYDELSAEVKIIHDNGIGRKWSNVKVIISCREDVLKSGSLDCFAPTKDCHPQLHVVTEWHFHAFSSDQVDLYLELFVDSLKSSSVNDLKEGWETWQIYRKAIERNNALRTLMTTPFMVRMVVDVLPSIADRGADSTVNRLVLYREFVKEWILRETHKIAEIGVYDRWDLEMDVMDMCKLFAQEIRKFPDSQGVLRFHRPRRSRLHSITAAMNAESCSFHEDLQRVFTSGERGDQSLVSCCPIKRADINALRREAAHSFVHKSLYGYFIFHTGECIVDKFDESLGEQHATNMDTLNQFVDELNLSILWTSEPSVLSFWADKVKPSQYLQQKLFHIVALSKPLRSEVGAGAVLRGEAVGVAAANALSILNAAGVSFAGRNLTDVCVREAYMALGNFDSTDFTGADLTGSNLSRAWLSRANFTKTQCDGIQFAEHPMLIDHSQAVLCLCVGGSSSSTGGLNIFSGSADKTIRVWDTGTFACLHTLTDHIGAVSCLSLCAENMHLFSGSADKTIRVWDTGTFACLCTLEGHMGAVGCICLSSDGSLVFSGSEDKTIRVWDTGTFACLRTLEGHTGAVGCICLSSDGSLVFSGSEDKTIRVWDTGTFACLRTLEGHMGAVSCVFASPDGRFLRTGSYDFSIRVWSLDTFGCVDILEGHIGVITSMCVSPADGCLLSASRDKTIRFWTIFSAPDGVGNNLHTLDSHAGSVNHVGCNDRYCASTGDDDTVRVWNAESFACVAVLKGHSSTLIGFDDQTYDRYRTVNICGGMNALCMSADGRYMITAGVGIRVWDMSMDSFSVLFDTDKARQTTGTISCVCVSQCWLFAATESCIRVWRLDDTFKLVANIPHVESVSCLCTSAEVDGRYLVSVNGKTMQVWDTTALGMKSGCGDSSEGVGDGGVVLVKLLEGHDDISRLCMSNDGSVLFSGDNNGTIRIWELSGEMDCLYCLEGHTGSINAMCVTPGLPNLLISGGIDCSIRVWDLANGCECANIYGHSGAVNSLCVCVSEDPDLDPSVDRVGGAADGGCYRLISGGDDKSILFWSLVMSQVPLVPRLEWRSGPGHLAARHIQMEECIGLSASNRRLLDQNCDVSALVQSFRNQPSKESVKQAEDRDRAQEVEVLETESIDSLLAQLVTTPNVEPEQLQGVLGFAESLGFSLNGGENDANCDLEDDAQKSKRTKVTSVLANFLMMCQAKNRQMEELQAMLASMADELGPDEEVARMDRFMVSLPDKVAHQCSCGKGTELVKTKGPYRATHGHDSFGCDICEQNGDGWAYHCEQCGDYDVHPSCLSCLDCSEAAIAEAEAALDEDGKGVMVTDEGNDEMNIS